MSDQNEQYFRNRRPEMLAFIPGDATVLLEVGCGSGAFAAGLKEKRSAAGAEVEVK